VPRCDLAAALDNEEPEDDAERSRQGNEETDTPMHFGMKLVNVVRRRKSKVH
jgi:hypothetical protein